MITQNNKHEASNASSEVSEQAGPIKEPSLDDSSSDSSINGKKDDNERGNDLLNSLSGSDSDLNDGSSGGAKSTQTVKDVTGMSLTRSPFLKKMTERKKIRLH